MSDIDCCCCYYYCLFVVTWMSYRYWILDFGINLRVAHILYLWHSECYSIGLHHWFAQWSPLPPQFMYKLCLVWSYPFRDDTSFNSALDLSVVWNACPSLKFISSPTGFCNTCRDTWEDQQILHYSISCFLVILFRSYSLWYLKSFSRLLLDISIIITWP